MGNYKSMGGPRLYKTQKTAEYAARRLGGRIVLVKLEVLVGEETHGSGIAGI
jgi:hypothetical protein